MARKRILPKSNKLAIALLISILLQIVFIFLITALDVLPFIYYLACIAVLLIYDVCVITLMNAKKRNSMKPLVGLILSITMTIIMVFGVFYMYNTAETLINISGGMGKTEKYHVIVASDSKYEEVDHWTKSIYSRR